MLAIAVGASVRPAPRMRSTLSMKPIVSYTRPVNPNSSGRPRRAAKGQQIARCPTCQIAVWSNYPQAGAAVRFVRVGTMDNPDLCPPDIHIFTSSKQSWVTLPAGARAVSEFYDLDAVWPAESLERRRLMRAKAAQT